MCILAKMYSYIPPPRKTNGWKNKHVHILPKNMVENKKKMATLYLTLLVFLNGCKDHSPVSNVSNIVFPKTNFPFLFSSKIYVPRTFIRIFI